MTASDARGSLVGCLVFGIATSWAAGCGGGHGNQGYPDAAPRPGTGGRGAATGGAAGAATDGGTATGGTAGAATGGVTASGGTAGTATGGAPATDGGVGTGGGPFDAAAERGPDGPAALTAIRLLAGTAALVFPGPSCSTPVTPAGGVKPDQWCGAIRPGAVQGTVTLSVFNLTQAMAGATLACTTGDPNCLLLSANLSTAMDAASGFFGETLVYYEAQSVLAWKPGWTAGRVLIAHDQVANCVASSVVPTAICEKATVDPTVFNLYAGRIDTQTGAALPLIEPISATGSAGFSVDQLSIAWSTQTPATAPETLKIQTIGDATTRRTVATNVTFWNLSPDGLRWFWLSQPVTDAVTGWTSGTLQSAPFPSGATPVNIHAAVVEYAPWSAKSMMVLATPGTFGGDLKAILDIDNPVATARVIEAGDVLRFSDLTASGVVLYSNDFVQPDPTTPNIISVNLLTSKADATGKCTVTAAPEADPAAFLTRSGLAVTWDRPTVSGLAFEGLFTTLASCATTTFSTSAASLADTTAGVILVESYNPTAGTGALGLAPYATDGTLGAKISIHPAARPTVAPLFPDLPRVVYSVNATVFEGGIYVSAPLTGTTLPFSPAGLAGVAAGAAAAAPSSTFSGVGARRASGVTSFFRGPPLAARAPGLRDNFAVKNLPAMPLRRAPRPAQQIGPTLRATAR